MKLSMAATVVAVMAVTTACDGRQAPAEPVETPAASAAPSAADAAVTGAVAEAPPAHAVSGAPAYAAVYPGAEVEGEPTIAGGTAGPGGLVTFTTDAAPEEVVAFYRRKAEGAGMASVMSMNQGEARAYGAAQESSGASVQVVASPAEDQETSVQLSWSAGE